MKWKSQIAAEVVSLNFNFKFYEKSSFLGKAVSSRNRLRESQWRGYHKSQWKRELSWLSSKDDRPGREYLSSSDRWECILTYWQVVFYFFSFLFMKTAVGKIFEFNMQCERTSTLTSYSRWVSGYSFFYRDTLQIITKKIDIRIWTDFDLSLKNRESIPKDRIFFIPSKIGWDIFLYKRDRYGARYYTWKGFILLNGKIYTWKITKGESKWSWSSFMYNPYSLELTSEVILPNTWRQMKRINEEYKTKEGVLVWNQEKTTWILQ